MDREHDERGRLSGVSYERGSTVLGDLTYQYDAAGRQTGHSGSYARTVLPPAVTGTTYDAANRLLTRTTGSGTTTLTRDDNGNVTGDGTNSYTWNARNRLVGISGGTSASFGYDALGRRASRTVGTTTTEFLYSGRSILREQVGTTYATLLTSPGGERYTRTSGSVRRTLLMAPDGDTIALADDAGTVQTEYSYGPQCETTTSGASDSNPYKCLGAQDDGTGLLFDGNDYFSPSLGVEFSGDPLGKGSSGSPDYTTRLQPPSSSWHGRVGFGDGILAQQLPIGGLAGVGAAIGGAAVAVGGVVTAPAWATGAVAVFVVAGVVVGAYLGGQWVYNTIIDDYGRQVHRETLDAARRELQVSAQ